MAYTTRATTKFRWKHLYHLVMLVVISGPNNIHSKTSSQYANISLSQVCPYTSFCSEGPALYTLGESMTPCCTPCSCQASCISSGNCCPDFLNESFEPVTPDKKCSPPVHTPFLSLLARIPTVDYYYIVDTCPPGFEDPETVGRCIHPHVNLTQDVIDVATVSDGEMVFSNRHCARCNNVTIFKTWTPILYQFNFDEDSFQQGFLPAHFLLYFAPEDPEQTQRSRCYPPPTVIDQCNVTGDQDFHDANLSKACSKLTMFYKVEGNGRDRIYKNPLCFLCNARKGTALAHQCFAKEPLDNMVKTTALNPGFAMLLDLTVTNDVVRTHSLPDICRKDEFYDRKFDKCRELHCPLFSEPVEGQCVTTRQRVQGLTISAVFHLDTDQDVTWDNVDLAALKQILNMLLNTLGLKAKGCTVCLNNLFTLREGNRTLTYMLVSHQTTDACTVETILNVFRKVSLSSIRVAVKIQNTAVIVTSRLNYQFSKSGLMPDTDRFHQIINLKAHSCSIMYVMNDKFCAYIELNEPDFNTLELKPNSQKLTKNFRRVENRNEEATVYRICIDDYKHEQSKSGTDVLFSSTFVYLVPLLLLM